VARQEIDTEAQLPFANAPVSFCYAGMGTKRFEDLDDCWRHGTGFVVDCLECGHGSTTAC
jgi:hypothetical protein